MTTGSGYAGLGELLAAREWIHGVFEEAARGLPLPHRLALMGVEQVILAGMFGGLLAGATLVQSLRDRPDMAPLPDLAPLLATLEQAATGPFGDGLRQAIAELVGITRGM